MKPESRPSSEQGLASAVNLTGPLITSSPRHPWHKHASFSGSLVAEVSSLCISSVCLITLDCLTTKPRDCALQAVNKEVVEIHDLLTRSLFGDGIPRNLPPTKNWFGLTSRYFSRARFRTSMPRCETTRDQYGTGSSFIDFDREQGSNVFVAQRPLTKGAVLSAIADTDVTGNSQKPVAGR